MLSAKYNENEEHVPELVSLQSITQQEIPREELLKYELWALQRMGWILCGKNLSASLVSHNRFMIIMQYHFSTHCSCIFELLPFFGLSF